MVLIAIIALLASAAPPPARAQMVWGVGSQSCGKWVAQRRAPKDFTSDLDRLVLDAWLDGFLSARPSSEIQDLEGAQAWIDNYCQMHPLDRVVDAADALAPSMRQH